MSRRLSSPSRHGIAGWSQRHGWQPRGDRAQHHLDPPHAHAWQGNGGGAWCCSGGSAMPGVGGHAGETAPCHALFSSPSPSPPGNRIHRKISSPMLSQGAAPFPKSPASHPVSTGQGLPVALVPGCGQRRDVAGRELPANRATLVSAGDRQHHWQGKIWGPGHCPPQASLNLTTHPVPLPAERRDC